MWKWSRSVVSDSSWSHGLQPTRLLRPWDFPGKSTGVGCHCLLRCYKAGIPKLQYLMPDNLGRADVVIVEISVSRSVLSNSLPPHGLYILPGSPIHGILPARILKWVAISLSRGSSQPRDQTCVTCIAGRLLTIWATSGSPRNKVHNKSNALESCQNHRPHPSSWKKFLPWNLSLMPKRLGNTVRDKMNKV